MMKELFYYQDGMMKQFEAEVIRSGIDDLRPYVVLSNTAFYPTGGGQPHDTGMLDSLPVIAVEKVEGEIRHYVEGNIDALKGTITAKVDWERRFDHMQQHCGQHILSAAFVELFNIPTISFHLGKELVTIDLACTHLTEEQLAQVEQRANEVILENRKIETIWVTKDELASYPVRKDVSVNEDIRLVIIPDYDYNGCGGTHPNSTGQVAAIKILSTEKMKKNIRLTFVCGQRVLDQLGMRKQVLSDIARQLSVPEENANEALRKVLTDAKSTEKAIEDMRTQLLQYEANELLTKEENGMVTCIFENRAVQDLQKLGRAVTTNNPTTICLLVANNVDKLQFIAARGEQVEKSMKDISTAILPLINGKGGGNELFVQGGGEKVLSAQNLLEEMKKQL